MEQIIEMLDDTESPNFDSGKINGTQLFFKSDTNLTNKSYKLIIINNNNYRGR